jgi:hypothetical protein
VLVRFRPGAPEIYFYYFLSFDHMNQHFPALAPFNAGNGLKARQVAGMMFTTQVVGIVFTTQVAGMMFTT